MESMQIFFLILQTCKWWLTHGVQFAVWGVLISETKNIVKGKIRLSNETTKFISSCRVYQFLPFFNSIDATNEEGVTKHVNDSSTTGNYKMRVISHNGKPYLCLFATKDIINGKEIRYDYSSSRHNAENRPWRKNVS